MQTFIIENLSEDVQRHVPLFHQNLRFISKHALSLTNKTWPPQARLSEISPDEISSYANASSSFKKFFQNFVFFYSLHA